MLLMVLRGLRHRREGCGSGWWLRDGGASGGTCGRGPGDHPAARGRVAGGAEAAPSRPVRRRRGRRGGGGHALLHDLDLRQQVRGRVEVAARFPHTLALDKIHADCDSVVSCVEQHVVRRVRVATLARRSRAHAPLKLATYL